MLRKYRIGPVDLYYPWQNRPPRLILTVLPSVWLVCKSSAFIVVILVGEESLAQELLKDHSLGVEGRKRCVRGADRTWCLRDNQWLAEVWIVMVPHPLSKPWHQHLEETYWKEGPSSLFPSVLLTTDMERSKIKHISWPRRLWCVDSQLAHGSPASKHKGNRVGQPITDMGQHTPLAGVRQTWSKHSSHGGTQSKSLSTLWICPSCSHWWSCASAHSPHRQAKLQEAMVFTSVA